MMHRRSTLATLGLLVAYCASTAVAAEPVSPDHAEQMTVSMELFRSHVRDVLVRQCLHCHGGAETHGEFDLSTREGLLKGGAIGPAVVSGKPAESLLLAVLRHEREPHMPQDGDRLPDEDIAGITAWIAAGAAYDMPLVDAASDLIEKQVRSQDREFWAFRPLAAPAVPDIADSGGWGRTPVDRFLWRKLSEHGLRPNPLAERRRLIRRASMDLLGIPPSPAAVERFLADPADDAYDRLVDELLASPHYGERWGRHWLDLARFAESHGYEQDYDRPSAYHYRDFVIRALNDDMPYDQFVRWQVAGDEFESENNLALMATGFLGAGTHATQITASQVEKERYDELDDMAATVGTTFLGLTIGCARCHDHKFDPIPQGDYYRLLATFTTTVRSEVELDLSPDETRAKREAFEQEHQPRTAALAAYEREKLPGRYEAWLAGGVKSVSPTWLLLDASSTNSEGGAKFEKLPDQSVLAKGNNGDFDVYTITASVGPGRITAIRLEALADDSLPKNGPGRAENGNFALSDFQLWAAPAGAAAPGAPVKLVNPKVTHEQQGLPISGTLDDNKQSAWAVDGQIGQNQAASFVLATPLPNESGTTLTFVLKFENNKKHNLGRLRLAVSGRTDRDTTNAADEAPQAVVDAVNGALATPPAELTPAQHAALAKWHREHDPEWQELAKAVRDHAAQAPKPALTKVMICTEGLPAIRLHTQGGDYFEETFYLKRGDLSQKLGVAQQSFLQVLMLTPQGAQRWQEPRPEGARTSFRRRALANWLADTEGGAGHLLARVIVNRLWRHHFGRGLVATPSDFGASGERPSHPELLDYLATDLIRGEWRLKRLHKLLMTSAAYMQTSAADEARAAVDPDNTLVWHRTRQRIEAEVIRDSMLAVSGLLDETMYGPGSLDESHKRRSIYFTIKRSQLIPSMMLFDGPDSLQGLGQRATTIVAPQALSMLNNPQVHAYARAFAERLQAAKLTTIDETANLAYEIALARPADDVELRESAVFIRAAAESYAAAGREQPETQALADFCQVLFGLNEFIYID